MKEGFDFVRDYLREHPVLYAATMGLDRLPQVHPAVFCCESEGALYFAETAKAQWPRMDVQPIERSALFETYDERERFTALAKKIIGNAVIEKVEDLSYWLSKETLRSLAEEKNGEKKNTP